MLTYADVCWVAEAGVASTPIGLTQSHLTRPCRQLTTSSAIRYSVPCFPSSRHTSAYVSIRQHTSAYVSIRQHTSAYVFLESFQLLLAGTQLLAFLVLVNKCSGSPYKPVEVDALYVCMYVYMYYIYMYVYTPYIHTYIHPAVLTSLWRSTHVC
jgi:hypothetical protein